MGHNYVENDEVGAECHGWRVQFERSLPDEERRAFYTHLAGAGVGRNCSMIARKPRSDADS
jgi:hypothetical protein